MTSDLRIQGEVVVNSEQAESAFNRVGDKAQQMATEVATSAGKAGQAVDKIGDGAGASAEKFTRAESRMSASIKRATNELELLGKTASQRLEFNIADKGLDISKFEPALQKLREVEAQAAAAQRAASGSLDKMGISAAQTAAALRGVPAQLTDIVVSLQGGQAPLTVFLQQGGQLRDMFGGAGAAARALGGAVLGMVNPLTVSLAAVAGLGLAYRQGSKEAEAYTKTLILSGNAAGTSADSLADMARAIDASNRGITQGKAAEVLNSIAASGDVAADKLQRYARAAIEFERAGGGASEEVAKAFSSLAGEPLAAVEKLNKSTNFLTAGIYHQIKALEDEGRSADAARLAQEAYAGMLDERIPKLNENLGLLEKGWQGITSAAAEAWDSMLNVGRSQTIGGRLESAQKLLADYENTLPGKRTTEQVARVQEAGGVEGLRSQIAGLQELMDTQRKADEQQRQNNQAAQAAIDLSRQASQHDSELEKQRKAVVQATERYTQALTANNLSEADRARLERDYLKTVSGITAEKTKNVRESAATSENEVASIRAKIAEQTRYLQTMQETGAAYTKLTEGERLVIKINEELQTGLKGAARANKEKALAAAEALVVVEKKVGAEQALAKSNAESEAAYRKELSAMAQRTDAIDAQAAQLEAANAVYGKGKIAIEEYTLQLEQERLKRLNALGLQGATTEELTLEIEARQRLIAAMKQAEFKAASQKYTESLEQAKAANGLVREEIGLVGMTEVERKKIIAARKAEIELAKELRAIDAMGIDESDKETLRIEARAKSRIDAETNAARAVLDDWQKTADDINRSLTDALLRGFESGKNFAQNLRDTLKNMFSTLVLRPVISAVMAPVSGMVNGVVQGGMNAVGLGGSSNLLGMASNASSLYGAATGIGSFTTAGMLPGFLSAGLAGSTNALAMGLSGAWGAGGGMLSTLNAGASMLGSGSIMSGLGTIAGALGPIALGLGAIAALSGAFKGRGANHSGGVYSTATTDRNAAAAGLGLSRGALGDFTQRGNTAIDAQLGKAVGALSGVYQSLAKYAGDSAKQIDIVAGFAINSKYKDEDAYGYFKLLDKLTGETLASYSKRDNGLGSDPEKAWAQYLADMGGALVGELRKADIPAWMDSVLGSLGDKITTEGLSGALQQIAKIDGAFSLLGNNIEYLAGISGATQTALLDLSGGIDGLMSNASAYFQNFYSADEQRAAVQRQLQKAFDGLDLKLPDINAADARAQFRALAEAQDLSTDAGRKTYATLLQLSGAFAGVTSDAGSLRDAFGITAESISAILRDAVQNAESAGEAQRAAAQAFEEQFYGGALGGLTDSLGAMIQSSVIAPMMESLIAGSAASASMLASGGAVAASAMASGGAAGGAASAAGGSSAAGAMASGGASAANAMVSGGSAAGAIVASAVEQARAQVNAYTKILSDPDVQAGIKDISKLMGDVAGMTFAAKSSWGGGGSFSGGGGGGGGGGKSEADNLAASMKKLGEVIGDEIKRLTGAMDDFDPQRARDSLLAEFAINTAKARSGDTGALDTLTRLSKDIESATKLTAASALDLNATRGWLAASLADTLTSLKLDLPKFAVGTNYVPRTMAAIVHEGEAIVPKAFNPWAGGGATQQSNARLEALVTQLIEDNRAQAGEIARLQARVARVVEKWDGDGMPTERVEAVI